MVVLLMAGCGEGVGAAGETYDSIDELREAYEQAGGSCDEWKQSDRVAAALESGDCDSRTVLSTYASSSDASNAAEVLLASSLAASVLVGENWIINAPGDLDRLSEQIGGEVVEGAEPSEAAYLSDIRDLVPMLSEVSDATVLELGATACETLRSEGSFDDAVTSFEASGLESGVTVMVTSVAVRNICPELRKMALATFTEDSLE